MKLKLNNLALALSIFAFSFTNTSALADDESSPSASPDPKVASVTVEKESKLDNDESVNKSVKSLEDKIREVKLTSTQVSLITEYFGIAPTEAQSMAQLLVYEFGLDFSKEQDLTKDLLDKLSKSKENLLKEFNKLLDEASVTIEETLAKEPMVQALSSLGQGNYNFISQAPDWIAKETTSVVSNLVKNEEPTAEETTDEKTTDKVEIDKEKEEEASEKPQIDNPVDTSNPKKDDDSSDISGEDSSKNSEEVEKGSQDSQEPSGGVSGSTTETNETLVQDPSVEEGVTQDPKISTKESPPVAVPAQGALEEDGKPKGDNSDTEAHDTVNQDTENQDAGDSKGSKTTVTAAPSENVTKDSNGDSGAGNTEQGETKPAGTEVGGEQSGSSNTVQPSGSSDGQNNAVSTSQPVVAPEGQPGKDGVPSTTVPTVPTAESTPASAQAAPGSETPNGTKETGSKPNLESGQPEGEGDKGGTSGTVGTSVTSGADGTGGIGGADKTDRAGSSETSGVLANARDADEGETDTVVLKADDSNPDDASNSSVPTEEEKASALSALKDAIANNELTYLKESQKSTKVLDTFYSLQSSYLDTLESFVAITNSQRLLEKSKNLKQAGLFVDVGVNAVTSDTVRLRSPYLTLGGSYRLDELITVGAYATVSKLSNKFEVGTQRTGNSTTLGVFVAGQKEGVYLALSYARTLNNYNQSLKLNDSLTYLNGYSLTSIKGQKPSIDTFGALLSYDYKVNEQLTLTPKLSLTQTSYEGKNTAFQLVNEKEETKDLAKIQYDPTSVLDTTLDLDATYNATKEFSVTGGLRVGYLVQDGANTTKMDRKYDFNTLGVAVEQLGSFTYGAKLSAKYKVNTNHSFNLDLNYSRVEKFKVNNLSAKLGYAFTF